MTIREIESKSLLRKFKKIDSWFLTKYSMNIYRGCQHNCVYCDGQSEKYRVEGDFESEIEVKVNAPELAEKEFARIARQTEKPGYIGIVGGVSDAYQPVEIEYQLTRQILQKIDKYNFPVMVLTKSTLIERDIDLLQKINQKSGAIVGMSFSSVDDEVGKIFEPGVAPPSERLQTLDKLKKAGIRCGIFLMPVIPFITDTWEKMNAVFEQAARLHLDFVVFGGMTLKGGRQADKFYGVMSRHYPELQTEYAMIYKGSQYGSATDGYYQSLNPPLLKLSEIYQMPLRIPVHKTDSQFSLNDKVTILLEQIDYLVKMRSQRSPYGLAAYNLSKLKEPIEQHRFFLRSIKGIGSVTEKIIQEIISTGSSDYYKKLLNI